MLTRLFPLQADLEQELEHKEALLAQCIKREAGEVCGALVLGTHHALGTQFSAWHYMMCSQSLVPGSQGVPSIRGGPGSM